MDMGTLISYKDNVKQIWICPDSQIDVAFVNGAECSKGTHINAVRTPIGHAITEVLKKKHKIDVTNKGINGKYGIFGLFDISNPTYNSQTKEELTNTPDSFYKDGSEFKLSDDFLKKCQKSEIVELVLDWYRKKVEAEDAAKIRKLNREAKKLLRSDKFINCNSKKASERELWIFEGDSAASALRTSRNPMTQAGYLMRGVPKNVISLTPTQVMKNEVFNDIINILGLQWGEYNSKENLKFNKIIFASDMDPDGDKIASLLLLWASRFPELFEQGLIYRCVSPIIVASKGKKGTKSYETKSFYSFDEYHKEEKKLKGYEIKHVKGLGTLNKEQSDQMFKNTHLFKFTMDNMAELMLKKWFGKGISDERKNMLKDDVEA
jgi:DNA topoisomerase-2